MMSMQQLDSCLWQHPNQCLFLFFNLQLQSIVAEKENEVKFLMRNKDEALKETELVIQKTETYEKTYLKKVNIINMEY